MFLLEVKQSSRYSLIVGGCGILCPCAGAVSCWVMTKFGLSLSDRTFISLSKIILKLFGRFWLSLICMYKISNSLLNLFKFLASVPSSGNGFTS